MSNPYGGSSYPGGGNNTPPSAPGSQPPSASSPQAPQYGGGSYGSGSYGSSSAGQSAPSAPGAPGAPSSPGGPSYPGGPAGSGSSSEKNGVGLWAMILGLAGILFGLLTGLPGAIMGMIGLKNVKNGEADNKGQALTGLIAGIITSIGGLIGGIIVIVLIATGALFSGGSGTTEPTSPQTQGGQEPGGDNGGQEPGGDNGGQEPGGNGGQEPGGNGGGNNGGGSGGNSSGKSPEIENGVNLGVRSKQTTAGKYAYPTEVRNKEYMFIEVVITNNSDSEYSLPHPLISAELNGKQLERVTDVETQKKGALDWPSSLAPGEEAVYQTGFVASGADAKNVKVTVSLNGKKFDFKNS
ncbi:DUF4190 domain-containing protein [Brevibacterium sp. UMB1308A]|uniref:DUF4190 domain-containing protein n=1 Tax=Brevibacterium sp. UMB1308A TaxID=3050608 RepID=UPI002549D49B|nr:DUF4190 domain-containing protein [Brevibacterium sp. UMB1308A]MDK8345951.1 DUF4190 domain-containing protein [Brevibacterium sp. UMB1308B]MDK8712949.1 DUF4190 domain-containing protein [Brevibacterium sp. UMB1308A]